MSRKMEDLKEMICRELDEIAGKGELSAGDVDMVYKLIVAKEKLLRAEEIEGNLGYSNGNGDWTASGSYGRGNMNYSGNSYGGSSYRDSYGRHYVRGHYSRDDGSMREKLAEIMDSGELNSSQRQVLQKLMNEMM